MRDRLLTSRCQRQGQSGLTLIETLCIVTLLALTAAVLLPNLAPASEAAQVRAAIAKVQDMDRRARMLAVREGPVQLGIARSGTHTSFDHRTNLEPRRVVILRADNAEPLANVDLLSGAVLGFEVKSEPVRSIRYNAHGHTQDYRMVLRRDDALHAWHVSGLTGWVTPETGLKLGSVP